MKLTRHHRYLIALIMLALLGMSSFFIYRFARNYFGRPRKQEQWMTVFVHGSFGTMFGLFSAFNVFQDSVDGTTYKKMTSHMRYDPFFHQLQPLLEPGISAVTPTFDPPQEGVKPAIYPVSAAYEKLTDLMAPEKEQQHFYVFGWSGLVSQQRRRKESLRFYNMLVDEYTKLTDQGITPKIRIVTHSHGGNTTLNLAGIHEMLCNDMQTPTYEQYPDDDYRHSMEAIHTMLTQAKEREEIADLPHQKSWDYRPTKAPFAIDELVILGTPIQPETSSFFLSPFFKKIYSFYSENDGIQGSDGVSTRRYYSDQRIQCMPIGNNKEHKITQIKMTLNKPVIEEEKEEATETEEPREAPQDWSGRFMEAASTLWKTLIGPRKKLQNPDPNHKEFWFMGWKQRAEKTANAQQFIKPYPYVIFVPIIQHVLKDHSHLCDVDVRIKFKDTAVDFIVYNHKDITKQTKFSLPRTVLQFLQEKAAAWQPDNIDPDYEMNILHRYSKMLTL